MKKSKKVLCLVIAFVMCVSIVCAESMMVLAAEKIPYQQGDPRWGGNVYNGYTFAETGCGIMSIVNAVNYLTGNFMNPATVAQWATDIGAFNSSYGAGTVRGILYPNITARFGAAYGFNVINADIWSNANNSTLKNHVANGGVAVAHVKNHFIALVDFDTNSQRYLVLDSAANYARRRTTTNGDWLTISNLSGDLSVDGVQYMNIDWFCLISATTPPATTYSLVATSNGPGFVHFGNNVTSASVPQGHTVYFQTTPNPYCRVAKVVVGGTEYPIQNNGGDSVYTFPMPNGPVQVIVTFAANYTLPTAPASGNYINTLDIVGGNSVGYSGQGLAVASANQSYTATNTLAGFNVQGWAVHSSKVSYFRYTVDGAVTGELASSSRADVYNATKASFPAAGQANINAFSDVIHTKGWSIGTHDVYVQAVTFDNQYHDVAKIIVTIY